MPTKILDHVKDQLNRNRSCISMLNREIVVLNLALAAEGALEALEAALKFIDGFRDDDQQEGISDLLVKIEGAIKTIETA